jgi:hypothetical protein
LKIYQWIFTSLFNNNSNKIELTNSTISIRFDLMVNGGGSVLLELTRIDLKRRLVSATTVWNQFAHTDAITMHLAGDTPPPAEPTGCPTLVHNSSAVRPVVVTSWRQMRAYRRANLKDQSYSKRTCCVVL